MPLSPLRPRHALGALATGLLVAGAATAAGGSAVRFAPSVRHRLPGASKHRFSQPLLAEGRVDRGRRTDLVAVYGGRLTPLLAHRHGRLVAQRSVRVPGGARHLLVGDVTGDHRVDAVVSYGDAFEAPRKMSLTVLRGDGRGGFRRWRSLRGYGGPIAVGDFNRDGWPDLVVGWAPGGDAALLLGAGAGRFRRPRHLGLTKAGAEPWVGALTATDIDRDGDVDLLVPMTGTEGGPMYLLRGNGRGGFRRRRLLGNDPGQVEAVAVGRFNRDHRPDIAELVTEQRTYVRVLLGTGGSHFRTMPGTPSPLGTLQVADIDGDGRLDALVSGANRRTKAKHRRTDLHLFRGTGDGTFSAGRTLTVCRNRALVRCSPSVRAVGDVDADRRPDLAVSTADARSRRPVARVLILRNRTR